MVIEWPLSTFIRKKGSDSHFLQETWGGFNPVDPREDTESRPGPWVSRLAAGFNPVDPREDTESGVGSVAGGPALVGFNPVDPREDTESALAGVRRAAGRGFNPVDPREDTERTAKSANPGTPSSVSTQSIRERILKVHLVLT